MPHSTADSSMRAPSPNHSSSPRLYTDTNGNGDASGAPGGTERFPDFDTAFAPANGQTLGSRRQNGSGATNAAVADRWQARRDSRVKWAAEDSQQKHVKGHGRQRSISNAIRHIRSGSMSQNAHELADALRAPVSYKLIVCPMFHTAPAVADILMPSTNACCRRSA
jgi:solute carrier family 35, member E1